MSRHDVNIKLFEDILSKEFVLCYRDPYLFNFKCERGYETIKEVDNRLSQIHESTKKTTILLEGYKLTPDFVRRHYIKYLLMPDVNINSKK